ncbi:MAG: type II toxin-antitoxin system RelE/ParE family toxin [Candidatus Anammoxibacter sp.]
MWYIENSMVKLKTKWFRKWAKKAKLSNSDLTDAIENIQNGLRTAKLGANLFKVRVARSSQGKVGSYRIMVVYKENDRAIFLYGFGKNEKENIDIRELTALKTLGKDLLSLKLDQIGVALKNGLLFEMEDE